MNTRGTVLNVVLADTDEARREDRYFSIGFYTQSGEYRYVAKAKRVGVKQHQRKFDYIGIQAFDFQGLPLGHPTPVFIYAIKNYRGKYEL